MTPMRIDFPYLMVDVDRHGNRRLYVRRNGHKVPATRRSWHGSLRASLQRCSEGAGRSPCPSRALDTEGSACGHARLAGGLLFCLGRIQELDLSPRPPGAVSSRTAFESRLSPARPISCVIAR